MHPYPVLRDGSWRTIPEGRTIGRKISILTLALLLVLLTLASAGRAAPQPQGEWVTLMAEDFEGQFPHGLWDFGRNGDP